MAERARIPTPIQVEEAQKLFIAGSYQEARNRISNITTYPPGDLFRKNTIERRRVLSAARIFVRSSINLARQQQTGPTVAGELTQAKQVIDDLYNHGRVQAVADSYFRVDMSRDKAAYLLTLAALTGNSAILTGAIREIDMAIAASREITVSALLQFERQRLRHRQEHSKDSFAELTEVFQSTVTASLTAKNKKLAARITARYILDTEKWQQSKDRTKDTQPLPELAVAVDVYGQIVGDDQQLRPILSQERRRELKEEERHKRWQLNSPKGETYSHLALS